MDDRELRKIALLKATEACGGQSTDYQYLLEAAEAIYQWLRGDQVNKPAQADLFDDAVMVPAREFNGLICDSYEWPVTREPREEPTRTVSTANGKYDLFDTDWPNPVVA